MMKRGDYITYEAASTGITIFARVLRMHRDGSVTYQALYALKDGKLDGCFLGSRHRQYPKYFKPRIRWHLPAIPAGSPALLPLPRPIQQPQFRRSE